MFWKNLSIQFKILSIGLFSILVFSITVFFYIVPSIKTAVYDTKKEEIKSIVDMTVSTVNGMVAHYEDGTITKAELETKVKEYVSQLRYGADAKDYLWINNFEPRMIMHPFSSDIMGKNLADHKDPTGKPLFIEMVSVCRDKGAGYVYYTWQYKNDINRIESKISYVRAIPKLDWIVGTGIYEVEIKEALSARVRKLIVSMTVVIALITGILTLFAFFVSRSFKLHINKCVQMAQSLERGDITHRIEVSSKDEFGVLCSAMNGSADKLENLVGDVILSTQNLVTAVEQISAGNQNLSERTSRQAALLEEVASTLEQAVSTIQQNFENAMLTKEVSDKSTKLAVEGGELIRDAISAITEINETSSEISKVTATNNEIAFKTNLLALNASVEAARAGDSGKSFAVVASEVRNLARTAGSSNVEISALIEASLDKITKGTAKVSESGAVFEQIMSSISDVQQKVTEIAAAYGEQQDGMSQINIAINDLDNMTQHNASLVEETASASEEMTNQAHELLDTTGRFTIRRNMGV